MIKIIAALATALTVAAGLVGFTTSMAGAEPYPGTVTTRCDAGGQHRVNLGNRPRGRIFVRVAGNARPVGTATVSFVRIRNGRIISTKSFAYRGDVRRFRGPKIVRPGRYRVRVRYTPSANSVFQPCRDSYTLKTRAR